MQISLSIFTNMQRHGHGQNHIAQVLEATILYHHTKFVEVYLK